MNNSSSFFLSLTYLIMIVCSACSSTPVNDERQDDILLRVQFGDKHGFINQDGKIIIEPQYEQAHNTFQEDLCFVRINGKAGFIDKEELFKIELPDSTINSSPFYHGFSKVQFGENKFNVINKEGDFLFDELKNDITIDIDNDQVYFIITNKEDNIKNDENNTKDIHYNSYLYNQYGDMIGKPYQEIGGFSEGICNVKLNNKWGFIDENGVLIIDTIFTYAGAFGNGLARVKDDDGEFYINKKGEKKITVDKTYTGFVCNRAAVELNGKKVLIDRNGKEIAKIEADRIYSFNEADSLATILRNGKALKIDTLGNVVLSTKYDYISEFINRRAFITKKNKIGVIDNEGNEIISPSFNFIGRLTFTDSGLSFEFPIINLVKERDNVVYFYYYDLDGNFIGKDLPNSKPVLSNNAPTREDFIKYFDSRLADLDPIEGIYYVTIENYYQNRNNPNTIGLNNTKSKFYAIVKDDDIGGFRAYLTDGSNKYWVNKFVKIGDSNNYAIMKIDDKDEYSSEGKMTLEDPYKFDFRLEQDHNKSYNFFVTYEFEKDYPSVAEYEKIQKAEWTGSGFAIADGYIATNYHVTSGAKSIRIKGIEGNFKKSYKAVVVTKDKDNDISILKIVDKNYDGMGPIPYKIGKTIVDVGENIFVLGYPKVDTMGEEIKVTEGIISSSTGFQGNSSMYQISAAVQPGNSGGPLFDEEGTVIGIVCAKHSDAENANYAIKISNLFSLINSSNLGIKVAENNVKEKKVSSIVKKVKNYVYLIECNSH